MNIQKISKSDRGLGSYVFVATSLLMLVLAVLIALEAEQFYLLLVFVVSKLIVISAVWFQSRNRLVNLSTHILVGSYFVFMTVAIIAGAALTGLIYGSVVILIAFSNLRRNQALSWAVVMVLTMIMASFGSNFELSQMSRQELIFSGAFLAGLMVYISVLYDSKTDDELNASAAAEEQLSPAALAARSEVVLDSIADGLIVTDELGTIKIVNNAALEILKDKRENLLDGPIGGLLNLKINSKDISQSDYPVNKVIKSQKAITYDQSSRDKISIVRVDKTSFSAAISINPVLVDNRVTGVVVLFRDLTEIEKIDRAKSEFVSLASHQLRTPLNVISWYIEKLMRQKKGQLNLKQQEYANQIYENNKRMILLVGDLLNASRVDLGRINIKKEEVDLLHLARQLVDEIKIAMDQKKIKFTQQFPNAEIVYQDGDHSLTTVIIQNLLSNALKYTNSGGSIHLEIEVVPSKTSLNPVKPFQTKKQGALISVSDTGVGIPNDQQAKIFSKLFRADNVTEMDVEGTGIGLYITQSFAQALGGEIWFESEEGKGTKFFVFIPFPTPVIQKAGAIAKSEPATSTKTEASR